MASRWTTAGRNKLTAAELADRERQALEAGVLALNGGSRQQGQANNCKPDVHGNSSGYLLAKLARDKPDYLKRWKSGEFKSVRAACLAAGIIKPQSQLTLTKDPFSSAQRIQEQRSQDWINDLVEALSPGALSATQGAGDVRVFLEGPKAQPADSAACAQTGQEGAMAAGWVFVATGAFRPAVGPARRPWKAYCS